MSRVTSRYGLAGAERNRPLFGKLCALAAGLAFACLAPPAFAQDEPAPGGGEVAPPAAGEEAGEGTVPGGGAEVGGGDEPVKDEPKVDPKEEARRRKREKAEEAKRKEAEAKRKKDEAKAARKAKEESKRKAKGGDKRKQEQEKQRRLAEEKRKRDEKRRAREKAARKKKGATEAEKRAATARGKAEEERLGKPEQELVREARMRTAGIAKPGDLPLVYVWSLNFKRSIRPDRVWVRKDIVLLLSDQTVLYCIRKRDGVPLWAIDLGATPQYPPAASERTVFLYVENKLVGIDRFAGQIRWRLDPTFAPSAAPCVADPVLYCPAWDKRLHAVQIRSREQVYYKGGAAEDTFKTTEYELRYLWHKTAGGHILATPALSAGFLYFGSEDGYLYAVSVDGESRYRSQTQGPIRAPVAAKGTSVYVGSGDYSAYAFDRLTGQQRWAFPSGQNILQAACPDVPSGVAFVPSHNNGIYGIFDRQTVDRGKKLWHLVDAEYIAGISPEFVYLMLTDKRLAAVEKAKGTVRWISLLEGVRDVVPNRNDWTKSDDKMRLFCLMESGHLVCLREEKEGLRRALSK